MGSQCIFVNFQPAIITITNENTIFEPENNNVILFRGSIRGVNRYELQFQVWNNINGGEYVLILYRATQIFQLGTIVNGVNMDSMIAFAIESTLPQRIQ